MGELSQPSANAGVQGLTPPSSVQDPTIRLLFAELQQMVSNLQNSPAMQVDPDDNSLDIAWQRQFDGLSRLLSRIERKHTDAVKQLQALARDLRNIHAFAIKNGSGGTLNPYTCVAVQAYDPLMRLATVSWATGHEDPMLRLFTGAFHITSGQYGIGVSAFDRPVKAAFTVPAGLTWQPTAGAYLTLVGATDDALLAKADSTDAQYVCWGAFPGMGSAASEYDATGGLCWVRALVAPSVEGTIPIHNTTLETIEPGYVCMLTGDVDENGVYGVAKPDETGYAEGVVVAAAQIGPSANGAGWPMGSGVHRVYIGGNTFGPMDQRAGSTIDSWATQPDPLGPMAVEQVNDDGESIQANLDGERGDFCLWDLRDSDGDPNGNPDSGGYQTVIPDPNTYTTTVVSPGVVLIELL